MLNPRRWQIKIVKREFTFYVDLYIWRYCGDSHVEVMTNDSKGQKILHTIEMGAVDDNLKPTLRLNGMEAGEIMKSLAEAIDDHGIKTDSDAKMAGLLQAKNAHLEDVQKMLQWTTTHVDKIERREHGTDRVGQGVRDPNDRHNQQAQ